MFIGTQRCGQNHSDKSYYRVNEEKFRENLELLKQLVGDFDLDINTSEARKNIGICMQQDVIYKEFNSIENIRFIGKIKGISGQELENQIEKVIQLVGLEEEQFKPVEFLSGGNKRKVSLALALIGQCKLLFLDEPTSGLDPVSRRVFWNVIEKLKKTDISVLLTTHYLFEAETLADEITIMSKGKLLIKGSSDFIKKKYGIGYSIIFSPKHKQEQQFNENIFKIQKLISIHFCEIQNESLSKDIAVFNLPFEKELFFPQLFYEIEQFQQKNDFFNVFQVKSFLSIQIHQKMLLLKLQMKIIKLIIQDLTITQTYLKLIISNHHIIFINKQKQHCSKNTKLQQELLKSQLQ